MTLVGANRRPLVSGLDQLPGEVNYFIGKDQSKRRTHVPTYAKVHYREVYPGIDFVYCGNQRQLEYDFVLAPGADLKKIVLGFEGADKLEIDAEGNLGLHAAGGEVRQHKPIVYQEINGVRRGIAVRYVLKSGNRVGFKMSAYDRSRPLVIDPVLSHSTYLGGSDVDEGYDIAVDAAGGAYLTGVTRSINFPTTADAFQPAGGGFDVFVTKLNPAGTALVYSTHLGGGDFDAGFGIAVNTDGNAYVTGSTRSAGFPTTAGAFQTSFGGGPCANNPCYDACGIALVSIDGGAPTSGEHRRPRQVREPCLRAGVLRLGSCARRDSHDRHRDGRDHRPAISLGRGHACRGGRVRRDEVTTNRRKRAGRRSAEEPACSN